MEQFELTEPTFNNQPHPWLRLHRNLTGKRKMMQLYIEDRALFAFWTIALTCTDNQGVLKSADDIHWDMRCLVPVEEIKANIQNLIDRSLIDDKGDGVLVMHDWDEHQKRSDYTGAERVRAYRERQRGAQQQPPAAPPLFEASPRNVTVTRLEKEKEKDIEEEKEETTRASAPLPARSSKPSKPVSYDSNDDPVLDSSDPDFEKFQCWKELRDAWPAGYSGNISTAQQVFSSIWGKPAPTADGRTKGRGIPDRAYFLSNVLPAVQAAANSERWAADENGKRRIHSISTFLTGSADRKTLGFMWLDEWPESEASIAERRAQNDFYVPEPKPAPIDPEVTKNLVAELQARLAAHKKKPHVAPHAMAS